MNPRTNDTMARDALPVNCCPAHFGFVYLSAKLTTGGKRRSRCRLVFFLLKSVGSGNRQERKITSEGKRTRWPMEKESTCSRLATVSPPRNQRPKLRTCREWEGREGGKFAGNCLSLPQSGIALETISLPPRISPCPREFQISFAEAETDRLRRRRRLR